MIVKQPVALNENLIDPNWPLCDSTEAALHSLLRALTSETYDDPTQHLEREQALCQTVRWDPALHTALWWAQGEDHTSIQ